MPFNISSIPTSSNGVWQGENPLQYAFPLLIIQTILVVFTSRIISLFLKPLRQPAVVAEILGGIVLGPSVLGRNKRFMGWIFPSWSKPILESVGSLGLVYFLFLMGLELDWKPIKRSGKKAFGIALGGISLPFILGIGLSFLFQKVLKTPAPAHTGSAPTFLFVGVSLSITAFPVLARILAELKLLTTDVGETAMAAAALNDVVAWILLALTVAITGGSSKTTGLASIWILLSSLGFVAVMLLIIRPGMRRLVRKCSLSGNDAAEGSYIMLILAGVMVSGLMTDMIGIHAIFGAFIFGLIIPKGGEFAGKLMNRIEDFVSGLLLPLYFASTGLKTDISKIHGMETWGLLVVVISTACLGKILGTFAVALMCTVPVRESLTLGVLMNTKGLVELIVLNIGREKKVLDDNMFTLLVMMALFTTFLTTPTVSLLYKPQSNPRSQTNLKSHKPPPNSNPWINNHEELRILACIRRPEEFPSLITLIDSFTSTKPNLTKLYAMHLVELTDRSSSMLMVQRTRKNGFPCTGRFSQVDFNQRVASIFQMYHKSRRAKVRLATTVSVLAIMYKDICHVAEMKRAAMIILPFHTQWMKDDDGQVVEIDLGQGWREVNKRVMRNAPCSVVVFLDRGRCGNDFEFPAGDRDGPVKHVCIVFLGGPDSCEALRLGDRMAYQQSTRITVIRFSTCPATDGEIGSEANPNASTKEQDEAILADFRQRWDGIVEVIEQETSNIVDDLLGILQGTVFDLVMVGKGRYPQIGCHRVEYEEELGPIGGSLTSPQHGINTRILVIQQYDPDSEWIKSSTKNYPRE